MSTLSLDEFLGHSGQSSRSTYLRKWKDRPDAAVNTFLHTRTPIIALWQHNFPRVVTRTDKATKAESLEVWSGSYNCHEAEAVLKSQYKRGNDPKDAEHFNQRIVPPTTCPACLLIEHVRSLVIDGKLSWVEPIFKFSGSDPRKAQTINAAGLWNGFGGDDLTKEEIEEMRDAFVFRKEAWKQAAMAKLSYLFRVVDADDLAAGVQVAIETGLLGDKVKEVIYKARKALGEDEGNPLLNPYCIRWEHHSEEQQFNKKYDAMRMEKVPYTKAVEALIVDADPPDVTRDTAKFNPASLRASLEANCLIDLPWDELFGAAEDGEHSDANEDAPPAPKAPSVPKAPPKAAPPKAAAAPPKAAPKPAPAPAPTPDDELVACDDCGKAMKASDPKCPHCGKVYEVEEAQAPAPPPMKTRAQLKAERDAAAAAPPKAAKPAPARAAAPPKAPPTPEPADDEEEDGIPF